jgi:DNA-binding IclR family transcriptional regulator
MQAQSGVPALERALDILELTAQGDPLSFGEIVKALELPTASTARILKVLCARHYLQKTADGCYECGEAVAALLPAASQVNRLRQAAMPLLERLQGQTGQTTILFHWNGTVWECIAKNLNESGMVMQDVGSIRVDIFDYPWGPFAYEDLLSRQPLNVSRVLLPENKVRGELAARMEAALAEFRRDGYVTFRDGDFRVTAPIRDARGRLLGALAVGANAASNDKARGRLWGPLITQAAQTIEARLSGKPKTRQTGARGQ